MNKTLKKEGQRSIKALTDLSKEELAYLLIKSIGVIKQITPKALDYLPRFDHPLIEELVNLPKEIGLDINQANHAFARFGGLEFDDKWYSCVNCGRFSTDQNGSWGHEHGCDGRYDHEMTILEFID